MRTPSSPPQIGTTLLTQLGYLILPAVTPILIWAAFHRDFLGELLPRLQPTAAIPKSN